MNFEPTLIAPHAPLPLQQHENYVRVLAQAGVDARLEQWNDVAQAAVIKRKFPPLGTVRFASRGPVWGRMMAQDAQADTLRRTGLHIINADGMGHAALMRAGYRRIITSQHVAELQVLADPHRQLALCHQKWRNRLNFASEAKLRLEHRPFDLVKDDWLFHADRAQQKAKKFRALPHDLIAGYAKIYPQQTQIMLGRKGKRIVAAMLFLLHGPVATYQIGWTNNEGRAASAHHLMLLTAAGHLADQGIRRMDLGNVDTESSPGLARFKIGSGATVRALGGTWMKMPFL